MKVRAKTWPQLFLNVDMNTLQLVVLRDHCKCFNLVSARSFANKSRSKHWRIKSLVKFDSSSDRASEAILKYPELQQLSDSRLNSAIDLWSHLNVDEDVLRTFPWLLLRTRMFIRDRIESLISYKVQIRLLECNLKGPLIGAFPVNKVQSFLDNHNYRERITPYLLQFSDRVELLSKELELKRFDVIDKCSIHPELFTKSYSDVERILRLVKDSGKTSELQRDLWTLYRTSYEVAVNRTALANEADMTLKPWMYRWTDSAFHTCLNRFKCIQSILGNGNRASYLQSQLNCNEQTVLDMFGKNRELLSIHPEKIRSVIALLTNSGFSTNEIILNPRVFSVSLGRLAERADILNSWEVTTLRYIHESSNDFKRRYKKFLEDETKKFVIVNKSGGKTE
ncbi:hypothetical protein HDE_01167 [Halotydeus destructor]|nr:hypothetical protein HDE_01167 [Halotydeus destructor]